MEGRDWMEVRDMADPNVLGAKAEATRWRLSADVRPRNRKRTTGTPRPRTFRLPGQVSWLADLRFRPVFPGLRNPSDTVGRRLAAYSCGGSAGLVAISSIAHAPASLLAPGGNVRRTSTCGLWARAHRSSREI